MDIQDLKREQFKLARKIVTKDDFEGINTIGGATCVVSGDNLIAAVVVCTFPTLQVVETKTYVLASPLPYMNSYEAYREMPAIIEAVNLLEEEPDLLLVKGPGILHPRKIGIASHLGLALNLPTIGVSDKMSFGQIENNKILMDGQVVGIEFHSREHAKPIYLSPGHRISLTACLKYVKACIKQPHKMPEPLHIAHKLGRKTK